MPRPYCEDLRWRAIWISSFYWNLLGIFSDYLLALSCTLLRFLWTTFAETAVYFTSDVTAPKHRRLHAQVGRNTSRGVFDMSDVTNKQRGRQTKWTDRTCVDLQTCQMKAVELNNSPDCPLKPNGQKEGAIRWQSLTLSFGTKWGTSTWVKLPKISVTKLHILTSQLKQPH